MMVHLGKSWKINEIVEVSCMSLTLCWYIPTKKRIGLAPLSSFQRWKWFWRCPSTSFQAYPTVDGQNPGQQNTTTKKRYYHKFHIHLPYQLVPDLSINSSAASVFGSCCFASSSRLCRFPQPNNLLRSLDTRLAAKTTGIPRCVYVRYFPRSIYRQIQTFGPKRLLHVWIALTHSAHLQGCSGDAKLANRVSARTLSSG